MAAQEPAMLQANWDIYQGDLLGALRAPSGSPGENVAEALLEVDAQRTDLIQYLIDNTDQIPVALTLTNPNPDAWVAPQGPQPLNNYIQSVDLIHSTDDYLVAAARHATVLFKITLTNEISRQGANRDGYITPVFIGHHPEHPPEHDADAVVLQWSTQLYGSGISALKGHEITLIRHDTQFGTEYKCKCPNCQQYANPVHLTAGHTHSQGVAQRSLSRPGQFRQYMMNYAQVGTPQWFIYNHTFKEACTMRPGYVASVNGGGADGGGAAGAAGAAGASSADSLRPGSRKWTFTRAHAAQATARQRSSH